MGTSRRSSILALAVTVLLAGCEPVHPPPAGYEQNCYGGNYRKTYVDSRAFVTFLVHAPESQWPMLAEWLARFGRENHVQVFDTSLIQPNVHLFGVSLCDGDGLFIYASKQNWQNREGYDPNPEAVNIQVAAYANHDRWRPVAVAFARQLQQEWPGEVAVSWQPEPAAAPPAAAR